MATILNTYQVSDITFESEPPFNPIQETQYHRTDDQDSGK